MKIGVGWYLVGASVLLVLAGCGRGFMSGERAPWRHDAEVACMKSGAVKVGVSIVRADPIEGPGMCGADFPLKVSALGEVNSVVGYADEVRPPGAIPNASAQMPRWPVNDSQYSPPGSIPSVQTAPSGQAPRMRWVPGPPPAERSSSVAPAGQPTPLNPPGAGSGVSTAPLPALRVPNDIPDDAQLPAGRASGAYAPKRSYGAPAYQPQQQTYGGQTYQQQQQRTYDGQTYQPQQQTYGRQDYQPQQQTYGRQDYQPQQQTYGGQTYQPQQRSYDGQNYQSPQRPYDAPTNRSTQRDYDAPVYQPPQRPLPALGPARGRQISTPIMPATLTPPATLACPIVSALEHWVDNGVQPAAMRWFGAPVTEIKQISAYSCRGMVGAGGSGISEHAFGNALDIAAFTFADGRKVTVQQGWRGTPEEQGFLRDVHLAACDNFTTVLAPGYNAAHYNHIHVDLMRRGSGDRPCRPEAISGEVAAAKARATYANRQRGPGFTGTLGSLVKSNRSPRAVPGEDGYLFETDGRGG